MKNDIMKSTYKDLLFRGFIMFFIMGTYFTILQDKAVSAYFLKIGTILQILIFTVGGGLLYAWSGYNMIKLHKRRQSEDSAKKTDLDNTI
jgi:hypothetical protein